MARGPKKHLKRLAAPKSWMLDKLGGVFAPRPSQGPHKLRECLPLIILIRNRLKYALTAREVGFIMAQRAIQVDRQVRTDTTYPAGFMDVISIAKTNENFRLLYDTRGRFAILPISAEESKFKLCRIKKRWLGPKGIPYVNTHDGRTIRYPHPNIDANDSVKLDLTTGQVVDHVKFEVGNLCMITGGNNLGRVGVITEKEKHPGSIDIVHVKDAAGHTFATRVSNVFVIGKGTSSLVSLPKAKGVKLSILEKLERRQKRTATRSTTTA